MRLMHPIGSAVLCLAILAPAASAQENYEIQVYGAPTMEPHSTMFELHSNYTSKGRRTIEDGMLPTNHALHETIEITQGLNDWAEIGFYIFTSANEGHGLQWVGNHVRPRVRVPESWGWPVGVSLSAEIGYQRAAYSADTWTMELRPIIDQKIDRWYWSFNPTVERSFKGPGVTRGLEFSPNAKVGFDFTKVVSAGVEYYGAFGKIGDFNTTREQEHQIFGAVDLNVSPAWEVNFGVGVGTTASTDHMIMKLILGRHVFWGSGGGAR